jgi:predicted nucleic acid-binding protein
VIVLDTNVVSELMRPSVAAPVRDWLAGQPTASLCTTAITVAEIRYGLERLASGQRKDRLIAAAGDIFAAFHEYVLPFDAHAAARYAVIVADRERAGQPIDGFDAQIAAICRDRGAVLATRNVKHFGDTGVEVVDPWQPR